MEMARGEGRSPPNTTSEASLERATASSTCSCHAVSSGGAASVRALSRFLAGAGSAARLVARGRLVDPELNQPPRVGWDV